MTGRWSIARGWSRRSGRTAAMSPLICGLILAGASLGAAAGVGTADAATAAGGSQLSGSQPPGRAWPSLAYDPAHDELVLFGGDNGSMVFGNTWIYRDGTWTKEHPARSPSPRTGAALVYDVATRQLLLFGGSSKIGTAGGFLGDTWDWNGRTWNQLHPATSPSARHNADMIYDAADHDVVLFGGYDGQYLGDTWTWNGTTWTQRQTPAALAPRDTGSFAYDSANGTGVLYGGYNGSTTFSRTWTWKGGKWTRHITSNSPGLVQAGWQMADDSATGQLLLFGGHLQLGGTNSDATWVWNGTTWIQLSPSVTPGGRGHGALTYDSATQQIVLFGGQGHYGTGYPPAAWTWTGTTWQKLS
jgi:hypothetical protein